jgi:hypothetical protein
MESIGRDLRFLLVCTALFVIHLGSAQEVSADCQAAITLQVTMGKPDVVSGTVTGVNPANVWVVVFVQTDKWYIQPYSDDRAYLPVNADGTYQTWIREWRQISAFVIRKGYDALSAQQMYMPFPFGVDCVDVLTIAAYPTIQFSGYEWAVKGGVSLGPGPNNFSASRNNVWVGELGHLHLKITQTGETWYCAEVYLMQSLGYGDYNFQVSSRVDLLDKNVIGSPFIHRDDTHELDVEFSRWGIESGPNAQFVVQPHEHPGNRERFSMSLLNEASTHIIQWMADLVFFQSAQGHHSDPPAGQVIYEWDYTGQDIPSAGGDLVHINLWLLGGLAPSNGKAAEMVIKSFNFATTECPNCSGSAVELKNETFLSGSDCRCIATEYITIGPGVNIQSGAELTVKSREVRLLEGFHAENGATVSTKQNPVPGQTSRGRTVTGNR